MKRRKHANIQRRKTWKDAKAQNLEMQRRESMQIYAKAQNLQKAKATNYENIAKQIMHMQSGKTCIHTEAQNMQICSRANMQSVNYANMQMYAYKIKHAQNMQTNAKTQNMQTC